MSSKEKPNQKGRMPSSALKRTLRDLEQALDRWDEVGSADNDSLNGDVVPNPKVSDDRITTEQAEFKRKTRELLESLREQLESL